MVPADEAWATVQALGQAGCAHFIDLNPGAMAHELRFAKALRRIEDSQ